LGFGRESAAVGIGHWQLEGSAAELYQRYLVPAITTEWAEDLVDRVRPRAGEAVLDVACGTGVVARLAAKAVGYGQVTGLDLNEGMLAVARGVPSEGALINWIEGSALNLPFPPDTFADPAQLETLLKDAGFRAVVGESEPAAVKHCRCRQGHGLGRHQGL
jgi:ubiquinone/menaquinone biosynthesis C-methylase UbiE